MAISDPSGGLLLQIEAVQNVKPSLQNRLNLSDDQLKGISDFLGPILEHAGPLLKQRSVNGGAAGGTYRMIVPPHLQEALKNGTARVVQNESGKLSGIKDLVTGKFVGHVRFQEVGGVASSASGIAGVLPLAAVAVATAIILIKLEQIDRKLTGISEQITDVAAFQHDEATSKLISGIRSLDRCQDMLTTPISDADHQFLRKQLQETFDLGEQQLVHRLQALKRLTDSPPAFDSLELKKVFDAAVPHVQALTLAALVMARASALASLLPEGTAFVRGLEKSRNTSFSEVLEAFQTIHDLSLPSEKRIPLSRPRRIPLPLKGLHNIATGVGYRFDTAWQKRQSERQTFNQLAAEALLRPAGALLADAQTLSASSLSDGSVPLVLFAQIDELGQVAEVFVETLPPELPPH